MKALKLDYETSSCFIPHRRAHLPEVFDHRASFNGLQQNGKGSFAYSILWETERRSKIKRWMIKDSSQGGSQGGGFRC